MRFYSICFWLGLSSGCQADPPEDTGAPAVPQHLLAFGDVHGDLQATRTALQLAGVIDDDDHWCGGDAVLVQTGDQLDRGDDERAILDWFEALRDEAQAAGGVFHPLLGNHEVMNVELDLRYVTEGGWQDFSDIAYDEADTFYDAYPEEQRGRVAAFRPGGPYALLLAEHAIYLQIQDTVFVHAGILPEHVEYGLELLNEETAAWMRGEASEPEPLPTSDAPVWTREYSDDPDDEACATLAGVLADLGAARMVMGHTVQSGITAACDEMAWLIDVGMADYYGGTPAVWELVDGQVQVLE